MDLRNRGFTLGFAAGVLVANAVWLGLFKYRELDWQQQAIEHNAAHYDAKTGEFTWNEKGEQP